MKTMIIILGIFSVLLVATLKNEKVEKIYYTFEEQSKIDYSKYEYNSSKPFPAKYRMIK